jgi:hypothetical protein
MSAARWQVDKAVDGFGGKVSSDWGAAVIAAAFLVVGGLQLACESCSPDCGFVCGTGCHKKEGKLKVRSVNQSNAGHCLTGRKGVETLIVWKFEHL